MRVLLVAAATAASLFASASALATQPVQAPAPPDISTLRNRMGTAADAYGRRDYADAERIIRSVTAEPGFERLPSALQYASWAMLALTLEQANQPSESLIAWRRATSFQEAGQRDWSHRLMVGLWLVDEADLVVVLQTLLERFPSELASVPDADVVRIVSMYAPRSDGGPSAAFRLAELLDRAGWSPAQPAMADQIWLQHALALLEQGRNADAVRFAARLEGPNAALLFSVDRRFDAIRASQGDRLRPRAALERLLAREREATARHPELMALKVGVSSSLYGLGRYEEALSAIDAALAAAFPADGTRTRLSDTDDLGAAMQWRAEILRALGRAEEAERQLVRATRQPERGEANGSQVMALAWRRIGQRRFAEALQLVDDIPLRTLTTSGRVLAATVRACAAHRLGDEARRGEALSTLRAQSRDHPDPLIIALACTGADEEAAQLIRGNLEDPSRRGGELLQFQTYLRPPHVPLTDVERALRSIRARPDLQASARRYGRIEAVDIVRGG